MGEWWITNGLSQWRVTDTQFKQWQRDKKIDKILNDGKL